MLRLSVVGVAIAASLVAGCSSKPDADRPSTGASASSVASSNSQPATTGASPPASQASTTTYPDGGGCGAYLSKPSRDQFVNDLRTELKAEWDETPADQRDPSWDDFSWMVKAATARGEPDAPSVGDLFGSAPERGVADFGKYVCSQVNKQPTIHFGSSSGTSKSAARNLFEGLSLCANMNSVPIVAGTEVQKEFDNAVRVQLCPQAKGAI